MVSDKEAGCHTRQKPWWTPGPGYCVREITSKSWILSAGSPEWVKKTLDVQTCCDDTSMNTHNTFQSIRSEWESAPILILEGILFFLKKVKRMVKPWSKWVFFSFFVIVVVVIDCMINSEWHHTDITQWFVDCRFESLSWHYGHHRLHFFGARSDQCWYTVGWDGGAREDTHCYVCIIIGSDWEPDNVPW